ncbi:hypothetical protein H0H93_008306, partial [Arthromyces matolae]
LRLCPNSRQLDVYLDVIGRPTQPLHSSVRVQTQPQILIPQRRQSGVRMSMIWMTHLLLVRPSSRREYKGAVPPLHRSNSRLNNNNKLLGSGHFLLQVVLLHLHHKQHVQQSNQRETTIAD